jgi:uncharacterized protein YdiU (UPF0061 family)
MFFVTNGWKLENTYAELPEIFFRNQKPKQVAAPKLVILNEELASDLGLSNLENAAEIFSGNELPSGSKPISQAYAGYQFGFFTMLGDGRAVLLGEQITRNGERFDIQLKGSGRTEFSRGGDGNAALLPMLREFIISEAMFYLGIPTTRSLAVALTGEKVFREKPLQGAVLTRVASSHIRVGTFNFASAFFTRNEVATLADYCIWRHFPELQNKKNKYDLFLRKVAERQAYLIARWQLVGFVHGVMNTDNMAISGETIDYGPCAFMDTYSAETVFSSIDEGGRYAYKNQPEIGAWNLCRFAESLLPLIDEELANQEITHYRECYKKNWLNGMRAKAGITTEEPDDIILFEELLSLMESYKLDFTNTFRNLFEMSELFDWCNKIKTRSSPELIKKHNPAIIPRNHRVEEALSAAEKGDMHVTNNLLNALRRPFEDNEFYSLPPKKTCAYKTFCGT